MRTKEQANLNRDRPMKKGFPPSLCFIVACISLFNTELIGQEKENQAQFKAHHALSVVLSHTQISQGIQQDGERKWLALPSLGLNYNYKFNPKWSMGFHNDIVIEDYQVEDHLRSGGGDRVLERSYPVASALVVGYKPGKSFSYILGVGGEFAQSASFFMVRIGLEYGFHINTKWELNMNLINDLKINGYNSFSYGIGITRIL